MAVKVKSLVGLLQLPVAIIGGLLCLGAIATILTLPPSPEDEGFVRGLAVIFLFIIAWAGFVTAALGLAIPPADGIGVQFNSWQRRLFLAAAGLAILSAISPLIFWTVVTATGLSLGSIALAWLVTMGLALLSFVIGLGWRIAELVLPHIRSE